MSTNKLLVQHQHHNQERKRKREDQFQKLKFSSKVIPMAKGKFLRSLTCRGSGLKSSNGKKDVEIAAQSDIIKSHEEVLKLLNNFPESESKSDRELSFSFLLNNSSPEKDTNSEKGGKTVEQQKEATVTKEKKKRRPSSGQIGVLLNLHVPATLKEHSKSRSGRETLGITLEELEKREMEFSKYGCWPALLGRKQDQSNIQLVGVPQLTC